MVIGIPDAVIVIKTPKTDSAIWYIPTPCAPKNLDKNILYKNPKNLSAIEKVVTTAKVLNKFLIIFSPTLFYLTFSKYITLRHILKYGIFCL